MNFCLPLVAAGTLFASAAIAADKPVNAGPYVPSPTSVVADMLALAEVGPRDFVIDLGSGDGRIVLTAAKVFGARGFGVDINDKLVKEANEAARQQGLADRASFRIQDLFKTDIRQATVLTMYLLPNTVNMLKDKLLAELSPGTRILSHDYPLAGWIPEKYVQMDLEDKVIISGVTTTLIYLYVVPAKAEGSWSARLPAALAKDPVRLTLKQQITRVAGAARIGGRDVLLEEARLRGERFTFKLALGGRTYAFTGAIKGNAMEGTVEGGGLKDAAWSAAPTNWTVERKRVNSSKLRSVGYDEKTMTLEIEFANGQVYQYPKVYPEVYRRFMAAPNPTSFFEDRIEEEYTGRRV